ncbi:hypothetical protein SHIRM173S_12822 [Streptomyces hirsutus]
MRTDMRTLRGWIVRGPARRSIRTKHCRKHPDRGPVTFLASTGPRSSFFPVLYAGFMSAAVPPRAARPQRPSSRWSCRDSVSRSVSPACGARRALPRTPAGGSRPAGGGARRGRSDHGGGRRGGPGGQGDGLPAFGDRTGLLTALLDHSEKKFQAAFLSGRPPLGPGAPPAERLRAFGVVMLRRTVDELDLQLAAEPCADRRFTNPPRRVRHHHVTLLLREAVPEADCELLAHTLMAPLDPALVHHLTRQCEMPLSRLESAWVDLIDRVTGPAAPAP